MKQILAALLVLAFVGCGSSSDPAPAPAPTPPAATGLALCAADLPGVAPCPEQGILTDLAMLTEFKDALNNGAYLYLDVPFDGGDPNIFVRKCGLQGFWNPADNTDEIAPVATPVTISDLFEFGNAGICAAGFDNGSFGTGEGFPVAGTYRKEFKVTFNATTYQVRLRVNVSGTSAGNTFAAEGIAVPADLQNTLVYEVDGNVTNHANVLMAGVQFLSVPVGDEAPGFRLDVRKTAAGPIVFTAMVEVICVAILP